MTSKKKPSKKPATVTKLPVHVALLPPPKAPFTASLTTTGNIRDAEAFTSEEEVLDGLIKRKEALVKVMKEAGAKIPDNMTPSQKQALSQVRAQANANAMLLLGEFTTWLTVARRARWINYDAYRDGVETVAALRSTGKPRPVAVAVPQPEPAKESP